MEVTGTSATTTAAGSTGSAGGNNTVDYDAFLKLLVAQLKNQDPTDPVDSTQYMAQLASFSNVEQAIQTNQKLDALLSAQALAQADGLIGRTATAADGSLTGTISAIRLTDGDPVAILQSGETLTLGPGVTIA